MQERCTSQGLEQDGAAEQLRLRLALRKLQEASHMAAWRQCKWCGAALRSRQDGPLHAASPGLIADRWPTCKPPVILQRLDLL